MRHSRNSSSNLLIFFGISQFLPLVEAQTASNTATSIPYSTPGNTNTTVIVGAVFGAVIGVALMMVSILFWLRRQTRKAREAASLESRKKGRYGTQNTSYGLDTNVTVPTGILSSFNSDNKSVGAVPQARVYNSYASERLVYEPSRQQSISISNGPIVPYQIPIGGRVESSSSLPIAFSQRSNELPIIRSLHRTASNIFKPLPEPPATATSPGAAVTTPPPPPVHSVAFPGLSSPNGQSNDRGELERSQASHTVTPSVGEAEQGRAFGTFRNIRPPYAPYAPYAQDYQPRGQRRGSDASTSSVGSIIGALGSLARDGSHWDGTGRSGREYRMEEPPNDARPRSQSMSSLQYGNQYREGSIHKYSVSRNPSTTSLSYYPDATSADGLARSYSQTVLARPESRASSLTSKKFENQLFSR